MPCLHILLQLYLAWLQHQTFVAQQKSNLTLVLSRLSSHFVAKSSHKHKPYQAHQNPHYMTLCKVIKNNLQINCAEKNHLFAIMINSIYANDAKWTTVIQNSSANNVKWTILRDSENIFKRNQVKRTSSLQYVQGIAGTWNTSPVAVFDRSVSQASTLVVEHLPSDCRHHRPAGHPQHVTDRQSAQHLRYLLPHFWSTVGLWSW